MARYDKYDPISGGFRAPLAADLTLRSNGEFGPKAVSVNNTGRVVVGTAGTTGLCGVLVKNAAPLPWTNTTAGSGAYNAATPIGCMAGDIVDIMTNGEIVDLASAGITGLAAGQPIYATAAGDLTNVSTGNTKVGYTIEANRMVVRVAA
ncbi:MAG: hypothetical protein LC687_05010 [Actinobacteria bacterium]|nr:hypothetical protein [Actinomycetota bacterium]MCA1807194.1 hypothetical protein [Actinomycetota bacterium]